MTCKTQKALRDLVDACQPVFCQMLHHKKADQHGDDDDCPVVARFDKALENAKSLLNRKPLRHLRVSSYHGNELFDALIESGLHYKVGRHFSIGDQFWLIGCTNVPSDLPEGVTELDEKHVKSMIPDVDLEKVREAIEGEEQ